jgi:plasmid maintenance system antidote protein VapI
MSYPNLRMELFKNNITLEELSKYLNLHRNSISNKVNGHSSFSIEEASKIQKKYFPQMPIEYLFKKED